MGLCPQEEIYLPIGLDSVPSVTPFLHLSERNPLILQASSAPRCGGAALNDLIPGQPPLNR
jgi:hypothetical protein